MSDRGGVLGEVVVVADRQRAFGGIPVDGQDRFPAGIDLLPDGVHAGDVVLPEDAHHVAEPVLARADGEVLAAEVADGPQSVPGRPLLDLSEERLGKPPRPPVEVVDADLSGRLVLLEDGRQDIPDVVALFGLERGRQVACPRRIVHARLVGDDQRDRVTEVPAQRPLVRLVAAGDERLRHLGVQQIRVGRDEGRLVSELGEVQLRSAPGRELLPGAEASAATVPAGLEGRDAVAGNPIELTGSDVPLHQRLPSPVRVLPDDAATVAARRPSALVVQPELHAQALHLRHQVIEDRQVLLGQILGLQIGLHGVRPEVRRDRKDPDVLRFHGIHVPKLPEQILPLQNVVPEPEVARPVERVRGFECFHVEASHLR